MYNLGLKTNIDLAGEARTDTLVYNLNSMGEAELATSTFGQGFNVTMIQMITAYCSLVNGGYYYEPHVVKRIVSPSGATVQNIEPRLLKQTVSETTSHQNPSISLLSESMIICGISNLLKNISQL